MAKKRSRERALSKPAKKSEPVYSRIVLKLSANRFRGRRDSAFTGETIQAIARE